MRDKEREETLSWKKADDDLSLNDDGTFVKISGASVALAVLITCKGSLVQMPYKFESVPPTWRRVTFSVIASIKNRPDDSTNVTVYFTVSNRFIDFCIDLCSRGHLTRA